jgi:hypothetical protein
MIQEPTKKEYGILLCILLLLCTFVFLNINEKQWKVYDCEMAQWHPDIPKQVREQCRILMEKTK